MINSHELRQILNTSLKTIRAWRDEGMPCYPQKNGQFRYNPEEVRDWLIENDKATQKVLLQTNAEIARIVGRTVRTISNLKANDDQFPKGPPWDHDEIIEYFSRRTKGVSPSEDPLDVEKKKIENAKNREQLERQRIQNRKRRGELVPKQQLKDGHAKVAVRLNQDLEEMLGKWLARLPAVVSDTDRRRFERDGRKDIEMVKNGQDEAYEQLRNGDYD